MYISWAPLCERGAQLEYTMTSSEGVELRVMDKFSGENFGLWKFKMEMLLSEKDLWDIVDGSEVAPPKEAQDSVQKDFLKRSKTAFGIIIRHLVDA